MRAAKTDANQKEIVRKLRMIGATVESLHRVGGGVPDLLVGYQGRNYLLEVKTKKGKTNELQDKFINIWRGQVSVIHNFDEAFNIIKKQ